jgi:hypothetical protein
MPDSSLVRLLPSSVTPARGSAAGAAQQIRRPAERRPARRRLVLEPLEERTLLTTPTLVVSSLADSGTGTLREAISIADSDQRFSFFIDFAVTGSINLSSALPDLGNNITIQGPGAGSLTVQRIYGSAAGSVFKIDGGYTASISGLTLAGGDAAALNGGGVDNSGTATIANCTFSENFAHNGGAIDNEANATATITGCTFTNNSAIGGNGGGIENAGTATVTGCTFTNNNASAGTGGGIDSPGSATIANCAFTQNTALSGGGMAFPAAFELGVTGCTFTSNSATGGNGGGVDVTEPNDFEDRLSITGCTLDGNTASGNGGGIHFVAPSEIAINSAAITNCILTGNYAYVDGGGIDTLYPAPLSLGSALSVSNCNLTGNGALVNGGGVANEAGGEVAITGCTFTQNFAQLNPSDGGGIWNDGQASVANCTLASNTAGAGGGIDNIATMEVTSCTLSGNVADAGGGIEDDAGTLTLSDSTLTGNSTFPTFLYGGGISTDGSATVTVTNCTIAGNSSAQGGGGLKLGAGSSVVLNNTIVADSPSGGDVLNQGSTLTGNHNLVDDGSDGLPDTIVANPLLGPLANYGGTTQTMALLPGSPAIDAGSNALAVDANNTPLTTDQRGVARIINGTVDIGAFESRSFTIAITSGSAQNTTVGTGFLNPLVVTVTSHYGDPVQGGVVTFAAPAGGASAALAGGSGTTATAKIDPADQAAVGALANTVAGSYAVTASARGASFSAGFSLTNTPGAAANITTPLGTSASTTVGDPFKAPLELLVTDAYGNALPGVGVTFLVPTSGPGGSFSGGSAVTTSAQGIAAPSFIANTQAGSYTVTALVSGVASVTFNLTNTPGAAARITTLAGSNQAATVSTTFATNLQVLVTDTYGNPVPGVSVAFTAPASGASGSFGGSSTVATGASGEATAPLFKANSQAGTYVVTAAASGVGIPASFSLANLTGAAASITATAGTPQSATVGYAFATPLQVVVTDAYGNPVPGVSVTIAAPTTGASGSVNGGGTVTTNAQGMAAATVTAGTKAGSFAVTASVGGVGTPASFSLTNTPDVASRLLITAPLTATPGSSFSFTVTAVDQYGNIATGYRGTVAFASTDPRASLPANYTFLPSDNGVRSFQATFNTVGSQTLRVSDTVMSSLTSTVTLTVSGKGSTPDSVANRSLPRIPPGAQIGALRAQGRRGAIHRVVADARRGVKLHSLARAQRLAPKR